MTTALVTGAARGLGLATCELLAERGFEVLATSRNDPRYPLDVTSDDSVRRLVEQLSGRVIDVLVNNAGVALDGFDARVAARTLDVNFFGALRVTDAMLPLLAPRARVVMVSSGMGELSVVAPALQRKLLDASLDREALAALMRAFVDDVGHGRHAAAGWPSSAYSVSKVGLNALTRVLAREHPTLRVNAVCPGWVRTAMGGGSAPRSVREGAASIAWAATLSEDGPTGGFFRDGRAIDW